MSNKAIAIDGKEYSLDNLSPAAKQQVVNLRMADREITRLQVQLGLAQTARNAYAQVLKAEVNKAA
jgi:hypothetical protein